MTFQSLKIGDVGEEVKTLKRMLRDAGYEIREGDVFDEETEGAVKEYQSSRGLNATGEAELKTVMRLFSDAGKEEKMNTKEMVSHLESVRPGDYESAYTQEIDRLLDQVMNREAFSYDPASDPMYQRYKDQYVYMGKRAMNDAIGQASSLSGGYGNSFAESAGAQAYQNYLAELSGGMDDMYKLALNAYELETDRMEGELAHLNRADQTAYERYLNDLQAYNDALDYYYQKLMDEQEQENWLYKNTKKSGGGGSAKEEETVKPNILTQSEFLRRKAAGAESLMRYPNYAAYQSAMNKKYSA